MTAKLFEWGRLSRAHRLFLEIAWVIILVKCVAVAWAIHHWSVPVNAAWVIVPTVVFATVVSVVSIATRQT